MNRTILLLLAVTVCFAAVQALECYECKLGIWNLCITTKMTCKTGEQCFKGKGQAAGFMDIVKKGCIEEPKCNKTEQVTFSLSGNNTIYTMTPTCCNTDLCNSATTALPGALQLALASVAALFITHALV